MSWSSNVACRFNVCERWVVSPCWEIWTCPSSSSRARWPAPCRCTCSVLAVLCVLDGGLARRRAAAVLHASTVSDRRFSRRRRGDRRCRNSAKITRGCHRTANLRVGKVQRKALHGFRWTVADEIRSTIANRKVLLLKVRQHCVERFCRGLNTLAWMVACAVSSSLVRSSMTPKYRSMLSSVTPS